MSEISVHIRHCMFYGFQLRKNGGAAAHHICAALGEGTVADRTYRDWFKRFREGDMSLEDRAKSRHPLQSDTERIEVLIEDSPRLPIRELSTMLGCDQSIIDHHLHDIGKVDKRGTWVPHQPISGPYSKQSPYVTFDCQNVLDTDFFNKLLLVMKSGF